MNPFSSTPGQSLLQRPQSWSLWLFVFAVVALVAVRVLMAWMAPVPLSVDEAQYLVWSRDLQAGYYSKPPVIAWAIHVAAAVCAPEPPTLGFGCIRFLQPLAFFGASVAVGVSAWLLFRSATAALWSTLLFITLPLASFYSQAATTDAWLLLFWSLALATFIYADQHPKRLLPWVFCGVFCGLGFLSKYSMALFGLGALMWVVWQRRLWLPGPWLALLVAFLVAVPNGLWNAEWGWPTLAHHADITVRQGSSGGFSSAAGFFFSQFFVMGPLTFLFFLVASVPKRLALGTNARSMGLLMCFAWPILAVVVAQAFSSRAHANWAAPASMAIVLMAVAYWLPAQAHTPDRAARPLWGRVGLWGSAVIHTLIAAVFLSLPWLVPALGLSGQRSTDPIIRLTGYTELAMHVHRLPQATLVLAKDRNLLAHLDAQLPNKKVFTYASAPKPDHHWQLQKDIDKQSALLSAADWPALLLHHGTQTPDLSHFANAIPAQQTHPEWAQALSAIVIAGRTDTPVSAFWVWPRQ